MAAALVVACPDCEKKWKPKNDLSGKKVKCPFCQHIFVVPGLRAEKATPEAPPDDVPQTKPTNPDDDADPYGVKTVELTNRCPNCTAEMGEHDMICLSCGYNTMTRQWGSTTKTKGVTLKQQMIYLLPPIGAAAFVLCSIIGLIMLYTVVPYWVHDSKWLWILDHESIRMWGTTVFLFIAWAAGMYCVHRFIEKPAPDEVKLD